MNLTAIVEKEQVYVKHFFDSVSLSFFKDMHAVERLLDVGAGAGFPGLPLKICFPHLQVTIIDSLKKRITFLEHVTKAMGMRDITLHHGRAEEFGRNTAFRERFDLVTARAVARLNVLSEYCLPFVKIGGTFAAMKGSDAEAEIGEAEHAIRLLGGEPGRFHSVYLAC